MLRVSPPPIEYAEEYFFESYKKQYGKTYLEDFPRLVETGKIRLRRIRELLPAGGKPGLLDIGCAYGPFLAAAGEAGFVPLGIDPAAQAVRYVSRRLGIPALEGFFPDPSLSEILEPRSFDVVSLWYVIEHFEDPGKALREINRLLKPGGVAAFSTPSLSGISGRRSLKRFLEKSPPDHWTIWTPRRCGKILALFGFELEKVVITGHHPERFPGGSRLAGKPGPVRRFFDAISRILGLGDTFEVYARKVREAGDNVEDNHG
jgi:2-polyprenyl-3-methyl-5-hydroxy-6-metoxy-1,4-benzoquinol methylase